MNILKSVLVLSLFMSPFAFANHHKEMKDNPCYSVYEACEKAGFIKGDEAPKGRSLWDDCKEPIMDGKAVEGVKVSAKELNHCKKFHADQEVWMKNWKKKNE